MTETRAKNKPDIWARDEGDDQADKSDNQWAITEWESSEPFDWPWHLDGLSLMKLWPAIRAEFVSLVTGHMLAGRRTRWLQPLNLKLFGATRTHFHTNVTQSSLLLQFND